MSKYHAARNVRSMLALSTVAAFVLQGGAFFVLPKAAQADTLLLFFDDFEDRAQGLVVGGDWIEVNEHNENERIRKDAGNLFAQLAGEQHENHEFAAITHAIPPGGERGAMLMFDWKANSEADASDTLRVILGNPGEEPLKEYSLRDNTWHYGEEVPLPDSVCVQGASLTFLLVADRENERVNIDNVRVTCEEVPQTARIRAFKYFDANQDGEFQPDGGDEPIEGWEICLYRERGLTSAGCKTTGSNGLTDWWEELDTDAPAGYWVLQENPRDGWSAINPPSDRGYGTYWALDLQAGDEKTFAFGNWRENIEPPEEDTEPPISEFDEDVQENLDHAVLDTEIVSLELRGVSMDNVAISPNPENVTLRAYQLAGEVFVDSFFDVFSEINLLGTTTAHERDSFLNVFHEISCDTIVEHNPIPPDFGGNADIPIELVALSLQSIDLVTVQWSGQWTPPGPGVYCLGVSAKDDAGNVEHTAWAGPVLFVLPPPVIAGESMLVTSIDTVSALISWITDHLATSRVVYDTVSHGNPLANTACPEPFSSQNCYGYAFSTPEFDTDPMVLDHTVHLEDLAPGTIYYYRAVSRGSPEAVSEEGTFATQSLPDGDTDTGSSAQANSQSYGGTRTSPPPSSPNPESEEESLSQPSPPPSFLPQEEPLSLPTASPNAVNTTAPPFSGKSTSLGFVGAGGTHIQEITDGEVFGLAPTETSPVSNDQITPPEAEFLSADRGSVLEANLGGIFRWWWLLVPGGLVLVFVFRRFVLAKAEQ